MQRAVFRPYPERRGAARVRPGRPAGRARRRFGALGRGVGRPAGPATPPRRAGSGARRPVRGASAEASPVQRHPGRPNQKNAEPRERGTQRKRNPEEAEPRGSGTQGTRNSEEAEPKGSGTQRKRNPEEAEPRGSGTQRKRNQPGAREAARVGRFGALRPKLRPSSDTPAGRPERLRPERGPGRSSAAEASRPKLRPVDGCDWSPAWRVRRVLSS
jgi:hypothetical protein